MPQFGVGPGERLAREDRVAKRVGDAPGKGSEFGRDSDHRGNGEPMGQPALADVVERGYEIAPPARDECPPPAQVTKRSWTDGSKVKSNVWDTRLPGVT